MIRRSGQILLLLLATQALAGCPARTAISVAGEVTAATIKTTGRVVGGTVDILTFAEQGPR